MNFFKKHYLEIITLLLYISLYLLYPAKVYRAIAVAEVLLLRTLPIFAEVVFLSAFLGVFLSPAMVQRFMGKEAGIRGMVIAVVLGTVIVGPMWAIFPLYKTFLDKGARVAAVGAMLGTFAIKTPWLPYAATFLGWKFVIVTTVFVLCYAVISGIAMEKMIERNG